MKLEIYQDWQREWRWRIRTRNGRIIADGGEGYKRRSTLLRMLDKIINHLDEAEAIGDE